MAIAAVNYTAALDVPQAVAASPTAMQGAWITMTSGLDNVHAGAVAYGNPAYVTLLVSPTQALTGTFSATLDVTGERSDGSSVQKTLTVLMHISELPDSPSTPGTPVAGGTPVSTRPVMPTGTATATASRTAITVSPTAILGSLVAATPQAATPTSTAPSAFAG